ncbi:Plasmodium exported protein, unknown function [Plasmodium vivax]|uniref:Variable surface protein n=1 Tax=Plasmodium vivax TaxID=5855 RepID=A0A565A678_PLAVI|nr:Plasmodium exported protein, unknown function [Plasmodium vivax]
MELLGKYIMKDSLKLVVLLKFFTFMFLIWNPKNDACLLGKDSEIKFKHDRSSNTSFNRLLAKHEFKEELDKLNLGEILVDYEKPPNINNEEDVTSTYAYLKKRRPINLYSYKKDYERRYSNKKGLAKLECYCEKKIFDKIDHIHVLAKSMRIDRNSFSKVIDKKYGVILILLYYLPLIGLIPPLLSIGKDDSGKYEYKNSFLGKLGIPLEASRSISAILIIASFIFLSVIIYIIIKFIKYKKLKARKGKMSPKEYYCFCKDLYMNK